MTSEHTEHSRIHELERENAELRREKQDRERDERIGSLEKKLSEYEKHAHRHAEDEFSEDTTPEEPEAEPGD